MAVKYTREFLEPLVKESSSIEEVMRKIGLKLGGGSHSLIKKWIGVYELDCSHFYGKASNRGSAHKGGPKKKSAEEVLILGTLESRPIPGLILKRVLIESGMSYTCAECNLEPFWNGKKLELQVDHVNGNRYDNRIENLRFLCPNCHYQTPTWGFISKLGIKSEGRADYYRQYRKIRKAL